MASLAMRWCIPLSDTVNLILITQETICDVLTDTLQEAGRLPEDWMDEATCRTATPEEAAMVFKAQPPAPASSPSGRVTAAFNGDV